MTYELVGGPLHGVAREIPAGVWELRVPVYPKSRERYDAQDFVGPAFGVYTYKSYGVLQWCGVMPQDSASP